MRLATTLLLMCFECNHHTLKRTQAKRVAEALAAGGTERSWGLKLGTGMLPVQGRVLPNPVLQYGNRQDFDAGPLGSWNTL